jgi:hypothetical protein
VPLPLAAERHYAYQQHVAGAAVHGAQLAWSKVSLRDLDGSWRSVSNGLLALVTAAQVAAARDADPYLSAVLAEQGLTAEAAGQVQPARSPVSHPTGAPRVAAGVGAYHRQGEPRARTMTPERALASGGSSLEMLTQTTVQDTGRAAVTAGMIARPRLRATSACCRHRPARGARSSPAGSTGGPRASNATRDVTAPCSPARSPPSRARPWTRWRPSAPARSAACRRPRKPRSVMARTSTRSSTRTARAPSRA